MPEGEEEEQEIENLVGKIMKNIQGTNSEQKEAGNQINDLEQKEELNIQPEHNEETRIQKNKKRLRNFWTI